MLYFLSGTCFSTKRNFCQQYEIRNLHILYNELPILGTFSAIKENFMNVAIRALFNLEKHNKLQLPSISDPKKGKLYYFSTCH